MLARRTIEQELRELRAVRKSIDARISFFERLLLQNLENKFNFVEIRRKTNGDLNLGIPTTALKPYVQEWIDKGHTLVALADKADVSESTIDNIMKKDKLVREETADKVLTALGIPHVFNELVPDPPEGGYYEE